MEGMGTRQTKVAASSEKEADHAAAAVSDNADPTTYNAIHGHAVLSGRHINYPPRPAKGLPDGWEVRSVPRIKNSSHQDSYYYSPNLKFKFRNRSDINRFLIHLRNSNGDEVAAIKKYHGRNEDETVAIRTYTYTCKSYSNDGISNSASSSTQIVSNKFSSQGKKSESIINVGDVGYRFRKQFEDGWYTGEVVKIRPGALGGKDRRCLYEDGDSEDLSLSQLQILALLDPQVKKREADTSDSLDVPENEESGEGADIPLPQNGSVYKKSEAVRILSSYPKSSRQRALAIKAAHDKGYAPISVRNIYKLLEKAKRGERIEDVDWGSSVANPGDGLGTIWEMRFKELKAYKKKHGTTQVPTTYKNSQLASWVRNQRRYSRHYLSGEKSVSNMAEKIARLKSIDFVFDPTNKKTFKSGDDGNTTETEECHKVAAQPCDKVNMEVVENQGSELRMSKRKVAPSPKFAEHQKEVAKEMAEPAFETENDNREDGGDEVGFRKSKRKIKAPPKVDEIYRYEHIKKACTSKKARLMETTPEKKAQLLASLDYHIPFEKAAELNFNDTAESSAEVRSEKNEQSKDEDDNEKEWLEKVAVSLGAADTSTLRQKKSSRPLYRPLNAPSLDEPSRELKASSNSPNQPYAAKQDTASVCSTLTSCTSDNNPTKAPSAKHDSDGIKQPPDAVLVSHPSAASADTTTNEHFPLLSDYGQGNRHGCLVFHRNDSRRKVGEVIIESDSTFVEVAIDSDLKEYKAQHLHVVPSTMFKAGDHVPNSFGKSTFRASPSKKPRTKTSPSEKNRSVLSIDHLFCWFCTNCNANNKVLDTICSCNTPKTSNSKRSILLEIAETAVAGDVESVEEALCGIAYSDRPSIPESLLEHLLRAKSGSSVTEFKCSTNVDTYFYWMCGSCTMKNSYKRTTCSACQGRGLADRSPLLQIAEDAAKNSQTTDDALLLMPRQERPLIPREVMDCLVTCVFMIESRNGHKRRCRKGKKDGYDYCEAHFDPILLSKPRADVKESSVGSQPCIGPDAQSPASQSQISENKPASRGLIAAISKMMPSFLRGIQRAQVNKPRWLINSIEDSVLCGEDAAFPLGLKVRKFFTGYGFHDGRLVKVIRKQYVDNDTNKERPVLVYRCKYNDGDQEDLLHHEITSLSQLYDRCNVCPEAPAHVQIPPGAIFETRSGHTIEIKGHKTPPWVANKDEGGTVIVKFSGSTNDVELDLLELQKAILRKIGGSKIESKNALVDNSLPDQEVVDSPTRSMASLSSAAEVTETATTLQEIKQQLNPVLEWPGRVSNQTGDGLIAEDAERYEICEGLALNRKPCSSPDRDEVVKVKLPASDLVNNPRDVRPGCNVGMWDPAACYDHLSWDPFASTVCELCGIDKDDKQVVICDECHTGFHTYCLRPVMVNIPKDEWFCSACSGRSNVQLSFVEYSDKLSSKYQDILLYLGLPFKNHPDEFFRVHCEALSLFSLDSQAAVKQRAISQQVQAKNVVFDVGNIKFIRSLDKNDWRLPTPLLSKECYSSSILSMAAAMKYCGMKSHLVDLAYGENANEEMNNPSLEVDEIAPMSKRNLEIFSAFKHNTSQGVFPPVQIIHDENFGFSVKVLASMPRHTLIAEYLGEVVTMEQSGQSNSDSLMVLLDTGDSETSLILDPTMQGNMARFLSGVNNRSLLSKRKANVRTRRFIYMGKVHVCLFTSRRVEAGEILNYDYNAGNEGKDVDQWARSGFYDTSNFF